MAGLFARRVTGVDQAGWGRTALKDILPVRCIESEDLRESSEGFRAAPAVDEHVIFSGFDIQTLPPVLGYNLVQPKPGCQVLARWLPDGDPLAARARAGVHRA